MADDSKGRRRNLKTVREMAESQLKQRQKPFWLKRLFQLVFWPIGALFQWLSQPLHVHESTGDATTWTGAWTKNRSMMPAYMRNSFFEIRMVTWPSFIQAMLLTLSVIIFAVFLSSLIAVIDWLLTQIFEEIILNKGENIRSLLN